MVFPRFFLLLFFLTSLSFSQHSFFQYELIRFLQEGRITENQFINLSEELNLLTDCHLQVDLLKPYNEDLTYMRCAESLNIDKNNYTEIKNSFRVNPLDSSINLFSEFKQKKDGDKIYLRVQTDEATIDNIKWQRKKEKWSWSLGHFAVPSSFKNLIGRNYWSSQDASPLFNNYFSPRDSWFGAIVRKPLLNKSEISFLGSSTYNTNTAIKKKGYSHLYAFSFLRENEIFAYQLSLATLLLDYPNSSLVQIYPVSLEGYFLKKKLSLHLLLLPFNTLTSRFSSRYGVRYKDGKIKIELEYSAKDFWYPLSPYTARSDSIFSSNISAYGARETRFLLATPLSEKTQGKKWSFSSLYLQTKIHLVRQINKQELIYLSRLKFSVANKKGVALSLLTGYEQTDSSRYFEVINKSSWQINKNSKTKYSLHWKSPSYSGSYPFPFTVSYLQNIPLLKLGILMKTYDVRDIFSRGNTSFTQRWIYGKKILFHSEIYLPWGHDQNIEILSYQMKFSYSW